MTPQPARTGIKRTFQALKERWRWLNDILRGLHPEIIMPRIGSEAETRFRNEREIMWKMIEGEMGIVFDPAYSWYGKSNKGRAK